MKYEDFEYNKILDPIAKMISQNKICKAFAKKCWDDDLQLKDEIKKTQKSHYISYETCEVRFFEWARIFYDEF